jgi:hypothetical protein
MMFYEGPVKKSFSIILILLLPAAALAVNPCENAKIKKELVGQREAELAAYKTSLPPGSRMLLEAQGEINGLRGEIEESEKACAALPTPEQQIAADKYFVQYLKKKTNAAEADYQKSIKRNASLDEYGPKYIKMTDLEKKIAEAQKELDKLTQTVKAAGRVGPVAPGEAPLGSSVDGTNVETPSSKPVQNTHAAPLPTDYGADRI